MSLSRSFLSLQTLYNGADDTVFINTRAANAGILQADDGMADQLYGGDGNDLLVGGGGADLLDGGSGTDTASYEFAPAAVNASLSLGRGTGGEADGDIFVSVENLLGPALATNCRAAIPAMTSMAATETIRSAGGMVTTLFWAETATTRCSVAATTTISPAGVGAIF